MNSEGLWSCSGLNAKTVSCSLQTLASVMENLPHTNLAELLISLVCLAALVPVKEVNMRFRQRLRTPIPVEILTVSHDSACFFFYNLSLNVHLAQGHFHMNLRDWD